MVTGKLLGKLRIPVTGSLGAAAACSGSQEWATCAPFLRPPVLCPARERRRGPQTSGVVMPARWESPVAGFMRGSRALGRRRGLPSQCKALQVDNRELLIGDCVSLTCFALYKQITALIFLPSFPGWLAPLSFNPIRFLEFAAFAITLVASWVLACLAVGGYRLNATADLPTALERTCSTWLISMPIAACQLVLTTAVEDHVFVTDPNFAVTLPLAASGAGEPLVTAAGVLGVMCIWRSFYTAYLDFWNSSTIGGSPIDRYQDSSKFLEAVRAAVLLSIAFCIVLRFLADNGGEEQLASWLSEWDVPNLVDSYHPLE